MPQITPALLSEARGARPRRISHFRRQLFRLCAREISLDEGRSARHRNHRRRADGRLPHRGNAGALQSIDFATIVLLFSMMVVVANLRLGGFFERIAEWIVERLHPNHLLPSVIFTCGFLSAFLVNEIVCLVITPFVPHMARRLDLPPIPYLIAVATASNIGSVATITGNPQNMRIGSLSGISYLDFIAHLGPIVIAGLLAANNDKPGVVHDSAG